MQKIFFIFTYYDAAYYTITNIFNKEKSSLAIHDIDYNPFFIPSSQGYGHDRLMTLASAYAACRGPQAYTEFLKQQLYSYIKELDANAASGKNMLLISGLPALNALDTVLSIFSTCRYLKNIDINILLIISRQDSELWTRTFNIWKVLYPSQIKEQILAQKEKVQPDLTYEHFTRLFRKSNVHTLSRQAEHPFCAETKLIADIYDFMQLPSPPIRTIQEGLPQRPVSYPGLDIARATHAFPFSFAGNPVWDRNAFYAALHHTEKEEGYTHPLCIPRREAAELLQACQEGNQRLAHMLGREELFPSPQPLDTLPDMPEPLPEISPTQCRAFVSALEPDFREALLRFFRDKDDLHPTELILARQLEDFRKRLCVQSPFVWPRKTAPVAVLTLCWNQGNYITQCMESVAEQRCHVAVDHIIVDDCSDDDSASRIDDFAARHAHVYPIYLQEHSAHGENVRALFSHCKSHYAALCDGDDYFTDPCKLQKQLDFLQRNKGCALCFHPVRLVYEDGSPSRLYPPEDMLPGGTKAFYTLKDLFAANMIQTNSVMYRWRFREGLPAWFDPTLVPGDWYWHLLHAEQGNIGYQPEVMSVYRRHKGSFFAASGKDHVQHRGLYGLHELRLYAAVERHFKGRFHAPLSRLATGVFRDIVMNCLRSGDDSPLTQGLAICPEFGRDFMQKLNQIVVEKPQVGKQTS